MNRALVYLGWSRLKGGMQQFCRGLRRPSTLLGFAAVASLLGFLFYYRQNDVFAQLVRPESLLGAALVMLGGSIFKGFLQRGLVFEPADVEFLFTGPFTQQQLVFYRLLPGYLYAVVQGVVFGLLFATHLAHPVMVSICLILFQMACFHISTGAAVFAGTLAESTHFRLRWMLLGTYGLISALYLRWAWDLKLIPEFVGRRAAQWFFYPALSLSDVASAPNTYVWARHFLETGAHSTAKVVIPALYVTAFSLGTLLSLWLLLRLKADVLEASLVTTARAAEKRARTRYGGGASELSLPQSAWLPNLPCFRGMGALVWKNLVVASRCRKEMLLALVFTLVFCGFLGGLLWIFHQLIGQTDQAESRVFQDFHQGVALMLSTLAFFLQWTFSFDFRRDGRHLSNLRTLPISPFALALAELSVPTLFCLGFQGLGVLVLCLCARLDWVTLFVMLVAFPAIALALNGVWNLHYLLAAARRTAGKEESTTAVGTLIVVALSFLVFYPAVWTGLAIGDHPGGHPQLRTGLALASAVAVQYVVDLLLVLLLARLFERVEVAGDTG